MFSMTKKCASLPVGVFSNFVFITTLSDEMLWNSIYNSGDGLPVRQSYYKELVGDIDDI